MAPYCSDLPHPAIEAVLTVLNLFHSLWCSAREIKSKLSVEITIEDIKRELNHWGLLTIPPDVAYEKISYYKYNDGSGYALEFELWINNQESDLTLSCEAIIDQSDNILSFLILDLHAL